MQIYCKQVIRLCQDHKIITKNMNKRGKMANSSLQNNISMISSRIFIASTLLLLNLIAFLPTNKCDVNSQDTSQIHPNLLLIVPQSFKLGSRDSTSAHDDTLITTDLHNTHLSDNYVAIINNIQSERLDRLVRKQFPKLVLQVRDASSRQNTHPGELVYEHVFDYFPENTDSNNRYDQLSRHKPLEAVDQQQSITTNSDFILIPIQLDQVSHSLSGISNGDQNKNHQPAHQKLHPLDGTITGSKPFLQHNVQHLIISIKPYQIDSGFGSDHLELVGSAPIPVEFVHSNDGQHSFGIVQTDKPIYKPGENVRIRTLVVNELLRPIAKDELQLQIRNPHKIIVEEVRFPREFDIQNWSTKPRDRKSQLFFDHVFEFPPEPMLGQWSVHLLHRDSIANDTTYFEVREYVLPTFEISFDLPKYILPMHKLISGHIIAKHHYGQPIRGKAQFKFGFRESSQAPIKWVARSNIKDVDPATGKVDFRLTTERIKEYDWFPTIAGSRFVLEASVTEATSGQTELAQDSSTLFASSPYRISFDDSIVDFRPGMSQMLTVQLVEVQTGRQARSGLRLEATYKDQNETKLDPLRENLATEAFTDDSGRASFNLGPIRDSISALTVTILGAKTAGPNNDNSGSSFDMASLLPGVHHTLVRHSSNNGWILLMNKTITELRVGDQFESDLLIRDAIVNPQKIFYLVVARSQIIMMRQLDKDGFVRFQLTEQMVPRIRIVLFALTQDNNGLLSDSMRLNVNQDLGCGMRVSFKPTINSELDSTSLDTMTLLQGRYPGTQLPDTKGQILIQARAGDTISVVGVDSAVYSLHNRTRSESTRMLERIKRLDSGCGFGGGQNSHDVFLNAGLLVFKDDLPEGGPIDDGNHLKQRHKHRQQQQIGSFCLTMHNQLKHLEDIQLGYKRYSMGSINDQANVVRRSRTRRDTTIDKKIESILRKYRDVSLKACCRLGTFDDLPQQRNCSHRARIVQRHMSISVEDNGAASGSATDPDACAAAYLDCCRSLSEELSVASIIPVTSRNLNVDQAAPNSAPSLFYTEPQSIAELTNIGHLDRIESETLIRRDFRETWLFELVDADTKTGLAELPVRLPHSMTSWSVSAMAVNLEQPMCFLRNSLKLVTFKEIFLQVSMPFKIVQGEQIDLVASIFNYRPEELVVVVYTYGVDGICSDAEPGERSTRRMIRLQPHSSQSLIYPLIPLKVGKFPIKILAISHQSNTSDIVERELNVVARGRPVSDEITFSLDPLNQQRRGKRAIQTGNLIDEIDSSQGLQRSRIRLAPMREAEYIVPRTQECIVSAIGDRLGNSVQTTLLDVENLIKLPHGCGEQVMIYLGPTLYTARYLSSIDKLTGSLRWQAVRYIQSGYKRILNFRQKSGAFSAFPGREPSIWLSAFVTKLLCQTEKTSQIANEIRVDQNVVNAALNWILDAQNPTTGDWIELNPVYHREMLGGVLKENALTSFVTISLNECLHHSGELTTTQDPDTMITSSSPDGAANAGSSKSGVDKLRLGLRKAEEWLLLSKFRAVKEKNPYVLALTAYALSFSKPRDATECLNELWRFAQRNHSKNQLFWTGDYPIETSGYALSALIELAPLIAAKTNATQIANDAQAIANWLSSRRSYTGAFESTQDTVVALEALSKLAQLQMNSPIFSALINSGSVAKPRSSLSCHVSISNRTKRSLEFDKFNSQIMQTFKLDGLAEGDDNNNASTVPLSTASLNGEILEVVTSGTGLGMMSVKLKYNVLQEEDEICHFNIDSSIEEWHDKVQVATARSSLSGDDILSRSMLEDEVHSSSNHQSHASEPQIEEEYFNQFSKPMLSELNLVYHTQEEAPEVSARSSNKKHSSHQATTMLRGRNSQPSQVAKQAAMMRFRRAETVDFRQPDQAPDNSSWASKLVTTIRGKFSSLFKSNPTTTTPIPEWVRAGNETHPGGPGSMALRRASNTSRRATQSGPPPPPLVIRPTGIPLDAKFNNLSDKLELADINKQSAAATGSERNSPEIGQKQLNSVNVTMRPVPHTSLVNQLRICVNHISSRKDSDMAVIEIGILSGFQPNESDLKQIIQQAGSLAMKYELSQDRSMVVVYLRYIPSGAPLCLQFRLIRDSQVHNLQSGYIRVYEYYSPKRSCSAYYTPLRQADNIETRCDQSSQVCECAARSTCPGIGGKMRDLGQIQEQNATSARQKLKDLVCSPRFDFVALVQLKDVRENELGRFFKLSLKVKHDLRGNLTKIMEMQRQQALQLANNIPKMPPPTDDDIDGSTSGSTSSTSSLDLLTALIDSSCIRGDTLLLHLAHPNQWRKARDKMIIFGRYSQLNRHYAKSTKKINGLNINNNTPKNSRNNTNLIPNSAAVTNKVPEFDDNAQQLQYSTRLNLDRDSIVHDLHYNADLDPALAATEQLVTWLDIQVRHGSWACEPKAN